MLQHMCIFSTCRCISLCSWVNVSFIVWLFSLWSLFDLKVLIFFLFKYECLFLCRFQNLVKRPKVFSQLTASQSMMYKFLAVSRQTVQYVWSDSARRCLNDSAGTWHLSIFNLKPKPWGCLCLWIESWTENWYHIFSHLHLSHVLSFTFCSLVLLNTRLRYDSLERIVKTCGTEGWL